MLDETLIKFVEPIGPGQIVDRESLVALPSGQIQITIIANRREVTVRVLQIREADDFFASDNSFATNPIFNAYVWQNGQVIAADRLPERPMLSHTKPRTKLGTMGRKTVNSGSRIFRFAKQEGANESDSSVVDAILQICVYNSVGGAVPRKVFIGTVHIALNYLTSLEMEDEVICRQGWFKVFPKSTFLPGCPASIAKSNCAISTGTKSHDNECNDQLESSSPVRLTVTRSQSAVSFSQYRLTHRRSNSFREPATAETKKTVSPTETPSSPKATHRIVSWVKRKILRQASVPIAHQRTPESARCIGSPDVAPVIVGPRRILQSSHSLPVGDGSSETLTAALETAIRSKTARLTISDEFHPAKRDARRSRYRVSRSNNSSFDVGYESGRSRCMSSSDEDSSQKSAESNLDTLCEQRTEVALVHKSDVDVSCDPDSQARKEDVLYSSNSYGKVFPKQRPTGLQRSKRISQDGGFTSMKEMHRRGSRGSKDSAICAS